MKVTADFIFTGDGKWMTDTYIETNDKGKIVNIGSTENVSNIKRLRGLIVPGFFNCHTHLELADARLGPVRGLNEFLTKMKIYWSEPPNRKNRKKEIEELDQFFFQQGVEFCADISNTNFTIETKKKSRITYHNFIEVFEKLSDDSSEVFTKAKKIKEEFLNHHLQASIVPHSLYSISGFIRESLRDYNSNYQEISSIHFKENFKENQLWQIQAEIYNPQTIREIEIFQQKFQEKDILAILNEIFDRQQKVIFVHNIYMNEKEVEWILKHQKNCAFCICPTSNINLEQKMTNYEVLQKMENKIFLGTDSRASNEKMSFINEMLILQENYNYNLDEIIKISSQYPSAFFIQKNKGKIKPGNQPGLVLLTDMNLRKMKLGPESKSVRII